MRYHYKASDESIQVREFTDASGQSPFARWFSRLNATAAAKITIARYRIARGNLSNVKGVGHGVYEYRIHFGPGYRIYFGRDGAQLVILLGGSAKKDQATGIAKAQSRWTTFKQMKSETRSE